MNAHISAINAKFVCKGHCAIVENFTVYTGNHARIIGLFIDEINESNKPKGYDWDVVVKKDVWMGCNVTLLADVTIGKGSTVVGNPINAALLHLRLCSCNNHQVLLIDRPNLGTRIKTI